MSRVFASVALADVVVLIGAVVLGFWVDGSAFVDMHIVDMHLGLAVFGCVVTCLAHVMALIFMVVIEKLTRQAVELGRLDRQPWRAIGKLKTHVTICLAVGVLTLVTAVGTGATVLWWKPQLHLLHQFMVWVALMVNFAAFVVEYQRLVEAIGHRDLAFAEYNRGKQASAVPR